MQHAYAYNIRVLAEALENASLANNKELTIEYMDRLRRMLYLLEKELNT